MSMRRSRTRKRGMRLMVGITENEDDEWRWEDQDDCWRRGDGDGMLAIGVISAPLKGEGTGHLGNHRNRRADS